MPSYFIYINSFMYLNNGYHAADEDEHDQVMLYPICSSEFCALHVK